MPLESQPPYHAREVAVGEGAAADLADSDRRGTDGYKGSIRADMHQESPGLPPERVGSGVPGAGRKSPGLTRQAAGQSPGEGADLASSHGQFTYKK